MAWTRPTLTALINRAKSDIEAKLANGSPLLRRSNLNVIAHVVAAASHGLYGYLAFIADQIIYDSAESTWLKRWASIWLEEPQKPATYATGLVRFNGTNGILIEAGSVLVRADGLEYLTQDEVSIVSGSATVIVTSATEGQAGNCDAGTSLTMASPIAGVNGNVLVLETAIVNGTDIESDESIRARLIARIKTPPQGGAESDYKTWALEVPGVTRAWIYPRELGLGTVTVRFVRDDDASLIPDSIEVLAVQAYIQTKRPVTANVTVVAPIADPLNFTIQLTPNTASVKAAVISELADLIKRESEPGGTLLLSHIREAISVAAGETNYVMSAPVTDVTTTTGHMVTMGVVTWL